MTGRTVPYFRDLTGSDPYPWQERLYGHLLDGHLPDALPLPTGLGKTSAVLLYLLALAHGAPLPVRLADRRSRLRTPERRSTAWGACVHRCSF